MDFNALPGRQALYGIRNGQGPRKLLGGMAAAQYVTAAESAGAFALTMLTGGEDAGLPLLQHADTLTSFYVLDGLVELSLADGRRHLTRGDSASIPPGHPYAIRMLRARCVVLWAQTGAAPGGLVPALGTDYAGVIPPASGAGSRDDLAPAVPAGCDTTVLGLPDPALPLLALATEMPEGAAPYAIAAGEGKRLLVADQLFTFAAGNAQTDDRMLTLLTEGPAGDMIPPHKHLRHDEMFFCVDGRVRLKSGDTVVELAPGDFLFVPRDTPHAYQFLHPYTRMVGWLYPGVFEKFFYTLGDPTELKSYPQQPAPFRFDRVLAALDQFDIVPLGAPPGAAAPARGETEAAR